MNIILIGMPSCGKSTIGVILAKTIGYSFTDTDLIIQDKYKKLLIDIINEKGMEKFLSIENDILCDLDIENTVIATGGSAIYSQEGINNLKRNGKIVYLKHRFEVIKSRLTNISTRGVIMRENQSLQQLFEERIPLYEKYADITIEADGLTLEQTVEAIMNATL